jgi:hypothetical protein
MHCVVAARFAVIPHVAYTSQSARSNKSTIMLKRYIPYARSRTA